MSKEQCKDFGNIDGMNGSCHYCAEDEPEFWKACWNETFKNDKKNKNMNNNARYATRDTIDGVIYNSNNEVPVLVLENVPVQIDFNVDNKKMTLTLDVDPETENAIINELNNKTEI